MIPVALHVFALALIVWFARYHYLAGSYSHVTAYAFFVLCWVISFAGTIYKRKKPDKTVNSF